MVAQVLLEISLKLLENMNTTFDLTIKVAKSGSIARVNVVFGTSFSN